MPASRISKIIAHPLRATLPKVQRTSQGDHPAIELVVVEVETEDGTVGFGEGLCRRGAAGYARFIEEALVPRLMGRDAADRRALWKAMRAALSGRPGGQIVEAIAAIDIALWDIAGKQAGLPIHKLLGGMGRNEVAAYASSINWLDDATVEAEVAAVLKAGFREIKVKLGHPLRDAIARAKLVRKLAGDDIALYVDANWAYDVDDALIVGRALADLDYGFFEEPIAPQDREGYRRLAQHLPIRLAAGESDFVASDALISLQDRSLGLIQPDVTRSGGISETWRICELAAAFNTAYAPHVGWSGAICVAASLQLAAAAETFRTFECMVYQNPLRDAFTHPIVGEGSQLVEGKLSVPQGPGLGIEIDRDALARFRIAR
ncbi:MULTISPECIES: mandelate racemase/muconate lactonizing enzyme family protein [unclassified Bosea (in: a-proteobacteria)]|uniref:mandelate racemase/muconate lactonizing enzyme family protein n=1 Tax=unclassified Bosea (in: a-proteobacteria) TaxID=2653178 RepID=UPI000F75892C|nr:MULTISPECIES: mandelate racemase/muconate lactonizing enzyme family protein [unclassified Bosea (in: a-proteobacteria)]AZO79156.1 mandelate racemase/muconate lactonizing protein [Bosea sp. Tri-49]RXT27445.1 mandelate racemase/muconate lactonizing protein [Bosea sp. Tri-39]RXT35850.1 mandelate racemase/muconate lactonizing protein [Bosea sp. Tri-54]